MALVPAQPWELVGEYTRDALTRQAHPLQWSRDIAAILHESHNPVPSLELGRVLTQHLCSSLYSSGSWLYLQHAMSFLLVAPVHVIALLTAKIIPLRQQRPDLYASYLDITSIRIFSDLASAKTHPDVDRLAKALDEALQISGCQYFTTSELGVVLLHFLFTLINRLAEATAEDWSGRLDSQNKLGAQGFQSQSLEAEGDMDDQGREDLEQVKRANGIKAVHLISQLMENNKTAALIRLARRNWTEKWHQLTKRLQLLDALSRDASSAAPKESIEALARLGSALQQCLQREWRPTQMSMVRALLDTRSSSLHGAGYNVSTIVSNNMCNRPAWLPFDIYMEDAMEGMRLPARSAALCLADLMRSMQQVQCAPWQDTFLAVWTAALRLVQRDRERIDGPKPQFASRFCMLLSFVPLAVGIVIEEEEKVLQRSEGSSGTGEEKERKVTSNRRMSFGKSLQALGQLESLLHPHPNTAAAANQAALAADAFVSTRTSGSSSREGLVENSNSKPAAGNLRHLIVESCIARGLLDTSAYFWPGMTTSITGTPNQSSTIAPSPWAMFMDGAALSGSLRASLISTPAGSLAELEKVYNLAVSGPEEDRSAAASILCGASLLTGWKIQEHAARLAVGLLSPPPPDTRNGGSYLISYAPMLLATLVALGNIEVVDILSLYGMFPELAENLLPICEVFGALPAKPSATSPGEDASVYSVFSSAFLLLLRLWKFHRPPSEHCLMGSGAPIGAEMNLEYLLRLRNAQLMSSSSCIDRTSKPFSSPKGSSSSSNSGGPQLVSLDSYPKLKGWYVQHSACIAAPLSGSEGTDPLHQHVERLLSLIFKKQAKTGSSSGSSGVMTTGDDISGRAVLSAWDIITATPLLVHSMLQACAYGKLAPRDLTTGLRELVDYLPATVATIVSYFTAEITRGVWDPASMNGSEWPTPAANLSTMETEIQEILTSVGVQVPSNITASTPSCGPASLPLPLAALVSLTITFKHDKSLPLNIAGLALEYAAGGSPWPSMPVSVALWAQKVPRYHDYTAFVGTKSVFKQSNVAVAQLLRSCFAAGLGLPSSPFTKVSTQGGVGALLGEGNNHSSNSGRPTIFPGVLYLRAYPVIHDITFLSDEILVLVAAASRELVTGAARDLAQNAAREQGLDGDVPRKRPRASGFPPFPSAVAKVTQATALGASFLFVSGGSTLAKVLYLQTLPTWFMSVAGFKGIDNARKGPGSSIIEAYAIAHFSLLSGMLTWGVSALDDSTDRRRTLATHMDFIVKGLEGKLAIGCDHSYWRAYVSGYLGLMVACAPTWIVDINQEILVVLARHLRLWHEHDLAVAVLERGGSLCMSATAELTLRSFNHS